ncbi:lipocalin family protein [Mucilaginibacter sp. AK015]|uniref:lipocalin family protein n=1 Tax=Mucilaginibacter sp. AK015 TaxID=2723072 RepID=UPI00161C8565|nr:lipocalin family protein [Mucilaginibacter sp. AK015]MBB5397515.1 hypothetical protein [Mucilaginibacter sp. AK015]
MTNKNVYFLLAGVVVISFFINGCKKEKQSSIPGLLTYGTWRLGSVMEYKYLGDSQTSVDTLECDSVQIFKFNDDKTCSYTNFDCNPTTMSGTWSLSDTKLYLFADITYPDITSAGTKQPFINSRITNLGEFSMVLETGDLQTYYTANDKRTIRRYGFIRIKPTIAK